MRGYLAFFIATLEGDKLTLLYQGAEMLTHHALKKFKRYSGLAQFH
jgi:hypothetical protein